MSDRVESRGSNHIDDAIRSLVQALGSKNDWDRLTARRSLVAIGDPAVPALLAALEHREWLVRWETAKALVAINSPQSAAALVKALEDEHFGVRWLAAEGLIRLGRHSLVPLLQALIHRPESAWLLEGAHHVLRVLADTDLHDTILPVLSALSSVEPDIEIVPAAHRVLGQLDITHGGRG